MPGLSPQAEEATVKVIALDSINEVQRRMELRRRGLPTGAPVIVPEDRSLPPTTGTTLHRDRLLTRAVRWFRRRR